MTVHQLVNVPVPAQRVILREITAGALNGAAFGAITGSSRASGSGSCIGAVIAFAILTSLVAGALGGILIPQFLRYCRVDPAVSRGAFVTTVMDIVGYGSFLVIVTVWFDLTSCTRGW
jgi:magnesium transporter